MKKKPKLECYLAFVYWNPIAKKEMGVPEGIEVRVMDYDLLSANDFIGGGETTEEGGKVHIISHNKNEKKPEVFFEIIPDGKYIELETNRLVSLGERVPGKHYLLLPKKWSSKDKFATDYTPGYFKNFSASRIGSPEFPLTFRLWIDCFVRFIYWNEVKQEYMGLPAGIKVEALDYDPLAHLDIPIIGHVGKYLDEDDPLGHGVTDEKGKTYIRLLYKDETRPDIYFKYEIPGDLPNRIDLNTNRLSGEPVEEKQLRLSPMEAAAAERPLCPKMPPATQGMLLLPRRWNTHRGFAFEDPTRRGYWNEFIGSRIGISPNPYVFDIFQESPRFIDGNKVDYLIDGKEALSAVTRAVESASKSIHVEFMLFFNDKIGNRFKDMLIRKAKEGVEVRLMFDVRTTGSSHSLIAMKKLWVKYLVDLDEEEQNRRIEKLNAEIEPEKQRGNTEAMREELNNTETLIFKDTSFPYVQILPRELPPEVPDLYRELSHMPSFTVARIDHRKMIIVDGKIGFLGGMNIGGEYFYEIPMNPGMDDEEEAHATVEEPWIKWHDCFCEIHGPAVREMQKLFRERWAVEGGDLFPIGPYDLDGGTDHGHPYFPRIDPEPENVLVKILSTTPGVRFHVHEEYISLIDSAKKEIYIENPYLSTLEIKVHLVQAAKRGVEVHYIFPDEHNDSIDFTYANRIIYGDMLEAGIHVYEYRNHMTHAKVAVFDNEITVIGSANFNHSALFNNFESSATIKSETVAADFKRDFFIPDIKNSRKISKEDIDELLNIHPAAYVWLKTIVQKFF
ncbi:MAG: phosphatidylserine/phosphatidylglycerophosphate/cardiolipin synthase family protein [bacterium]|nr:phosphatidylserine/phosphatidylglycerophosphate/cardiolipin synthase family protein [bacterium]